MNSKLEEHPCTELSPNSADRVGDGETDTLAHHPAYWTYDGECHAYYFAPTNRRPPPYLHQEHVSAIIDVANDGTLAGVEIIDVGAPKPPAA